MMCNRYLLLHHVHVTIHILLVGLLGIFCYPQLKCPETEQWGLRAQNCTKPDGYVCLLNIKSARYGEACISAPQKEISSGYRRVFANGGIHGIECGDGKYQPFRFWTNGYSDCIYKKSKCNEEGQLLHHPGYHTTDSLCRCDYKLGYDFVVRPKEGCFCMPMEEDCSCYKKNCSPGFVLTQDYECRDVNRLPMEFTCLAVSNESPILEASDEGLSPITDETPETKSLYKLRIILFLLIMGVIMYIVLIERVQYEFVPVPLSHDEQRRGLQTI